MKSWITEKEYRQSGGPAVGLGINVPFMAEIKEDCDFRQKLERLEESLSNSTPPTNREVAEWLGSLRDDLGTYFALEAFYGYVKQASESIPPLSKQASELAAEHSELYLQLDRIVELSEQIVYQETTADITVAQVIQLLSRFRQNFLVHEEQESALMMELYNRDLGVGD